MAVVVAGGLALGLHGVADGVQFFRSVVGAVGQALIQKGLDGLAITGPAAGLKEGAFIPIQPQPTAARGNVSVNSGLERSRSVSSNPEDKLTAFVTGKEPVK